MATTEKKKFKNKKLFQVVRELNVSQDRVVEFLEEAGYEDALSGSGLNAKIVDEEAYLRLREEYADDAQAAERIRELRQMEDEGPDRDEVASLEDEADAVAESDTGAAEASADEPVAESSEEAPEATADAVADEASADETPAEASDAEAVSADAQETPADGSSDEAEPAADASTADEPVAEAPASNEAVAEDASAAEATADEAATDEAPAGAPVADEPVAEEDEAEAVSDESGEDADAPEAAAEAEGEAPVAESAEADAATAADAVADEPAEPAAEAAGDGAEPAAADAEPSDAVAEDAVGEGAVAEDAPAEDVAAEGEAESADAVAETGASDEDDAAAEATVDADASPDAPKGEAEADADAEADDTADAVSPEDTPLAASKAERTEIDTDDVESIRESDEEDEDAATETLKASRYRLSGTNVVGKVDLDKLRRPKRKRKRKKKKDDDDSSDSRKDRKSKKQKKQKKKKQKSRSKNRKVDEEDVEQTIQETLQELEQGASRARQRRRRRRRQRHEEERQRRRQREAEQEDVLRVTEFVTTGELANLMGEPVKEVISTLFDAGMMVSINQRLDAETIEFVADEYGMDVEFIEEFSEDMIELEEDDPADLEPRAPVVTVMGHVDHGKTSLLDYIRNANVVAGEEGGITQHIGAHYVELTDKDDAAITFLDTPGHEAFTAMRARGAKATDIVILVVAADDSVMPQTVEAINHAQAADVPLVVAINKMDKPEADPQKVKAELAEHNVLVEEYGGSVQVAEVSAETGEGIDDLLDKVNLQAEIMELKANPNRQADGIIIESRLEKGRGNVITVLVRNGTLNVGDPFLAGMYSGSVRAMFDERDNRIDAVGPAHPALVLGCDGSPEVGDQFIALKDEGIARDIAQERQRIHREQELRRKSQVSLDQISRRMAEGEFHELNLIVKGDVGGSVEALSDSLLKLKTDEVAVNIIHKGVGAINESDVMLARASDAVIIGFQVRPTQGARKTADQEEVDIRTYSIIYDAIEDVHDALEGLLSPEEREEIKGHAEVRDIFKVPNVGTVAGSYVTDGTISRNHRIRVVREGVVTYEGRLGSLKRFQEDVKEVQSGYECGISIENFNDIKVGDELETYVVVEEKRTLEV